MALLDLLNREATGSRRDIVIAILVSGAANTVILAVINAAALTVSQQALNLRLMLMFVTAMALYVIGLIYTFDAATQMFEQMLVSVRIRLAQTISMSELLVLHQIGKARIYQSITQDTAYISEAQGLLVAAAQSSVMVLFTALYVMTLSMPAFIAIVGVIVAGALIYLSREQQMTGLMRESAAEEVRFVGMTGDLIDGLKEIKLSRARRAGLLADIDQAAFSLRDLKIKTTDLYNKNAVFSQSFFYLLLAVVVFVLPRLLQGFAHAAPQLVATILFIIGPLSTIVTALPALTKANRAADSLVQLEAEIEGIAEGPGAPALAAPMAFKTAIRCQGVAFHYPHDDADAFRIGPIDLTLPKGEITLFVGGNGSGKTTLLKLIAGLYPLTGGSLSLDGAILRPDRLQDYRELFGAIFSDFHLFPKLYGIAAEGEAIAAALDRLRIGQKIGYGERGFTTLDLSTGQRKRVAMVAALLEDRPILIFDEWAAEQDPEFRRYFYEVLLPELKARGKTLLVATHDDRYFSVADTVVTMELGRIQSLRRQAAP